MLVQLPTIKPFSQGMNGLIFSSKETMIVALCIELCWSHTGISQGQDKIYYCAPKEDSTELLSCLIYFDWQTPCAAIRLTPQQGSTSGSSLGLSGQPTMIVLMQLPCITFHES